MSFTRKFFDQGGVEVQVWGPKGREVVPTVVVSDADGKEVFCSRRWEAFGCSPVLRCFWRNPPDLKGLKARAIELEAGPFGIGDTEPISLD